MAKKRKKQNLAGMDFASLVNLRTQVESALSGHRTTLEKQLAALGGSIASLGGKIARSGRGSAWLNSSMPDCPPLRPYFAGHLQNAGSRN